MIGLGYGLLEGAREGMPPAVLSASRCICKRWPTIDEWRPSAPQKAELDRLAAEGKIASPDLFLDLATARRFAGGRRLLGFEVGEEDGAKITANGLPSTEAGRIDEGAELEEGGTPVGYEIVSCDWGLGHSMRCSNAEVVAARVGIALGPNGLFVEEDDARRCLAAIAAQGYAMEDGTWVVVHLVEYADVERGPPMR